MKVLIPILIGLLVVGCGKKEQRANPKDKNGTATSVEATDKSPKAAKVIPNSPEAKAVIDKAIRKAANKSTGELTAADLEKVIQLELVEAGITDLSSLKGLSNLKRLSLSKNQITDLKPIQGLTQLEALWLDGNKIQDLSPLAGMTKLQQLMLHINQISDLKPLSDLTEINYFALTDNLVEDLTPLEGMKKLQQLFLLRNPSLTTVHIEKLQAKLPKCTISHNAKSNIDVEKLTRRAEEANRQTDGSKLIVQGEMAMQNINGQFTPFTGTAIYYYENGTVHKQHVYVDGLMEGKSQWWHENGTKAGEAVKKQGKWDGAYMEWHENGLPKVKATYKDGAMAGVAIKFHENGRIAERATFADGKPVSLQAFDEQGQPIKKK